MIIKLNNLNDNPAEFIEDLYEAKYPENMRNLPFELALSNNFIQLSDPDLFSSMIPDDQMVPVDVRIIGSDSESFRLIKLNTKGANKSLTTMSNDLAYGLEAIETMDAEEKSKYEFEVHAWDGKFKTKTQIKIEILDLNDNPPIFNQKLYNFKCNENVPKGTIIGNVQATDLDVTDINKKISYKILSTHATPNIESNEHREVFNVFNVFHIDSDSGEIIVENSQKLDREMILSFNLTIMAYNNDGIKYDISNVIVNLNDLNDNIPRFRKEIYNVAIREKFNLLPRSLITLKAVDFDLFENGTIRYRIDSINGRRIYLNKDQEMKNSNSSIFYINPLTGDLFLNYFIDMDSEENTIDKKSFEINIIAYDMGNIVVNKQSCLVIVKCIDINDHHPEFLKPTSLGNMNFLFLFFMLASIY